MFDPPPAPAGRGGSQHIPRPPNVRLGGPAPWAELPESRRRPGLEQVLQAVASTAPEFVPSPATVPPGSAPSGVLVLLYEHGGEPWVVLTRRAWHLRHHAGEVSFPGGRREPGDADLWATALREATEEIGLDPGSVSRIGRLDSFVTVGSRSLVCPFVATAARRPDLVPDPVEVERVLHVRLAELTDPETWREEVWSLDAALGGERTMTFFELHGDTVWGATAAVLRRLLSVATVGVDAG